MILSGEDIDYYDKVLAGMTASLASGASVALFTSVPVPYAVGGGAAVSIGIMYHGMFRNGPMG
ncbi:MAG: hypothetical protein ABEJ64_01865 [Candidatus Nanohaloarchaea archaeon]